MTLPFEPWSTRMSKALRPHAETEELTRLHRRTLMKIRQRLREENMGPLTRAIHRSHRLRRRRALLNIRRSLRKKLMALTERYYATSAWLFVAEAGQFLCARIVCNTEHSGYSINFHDSKSVVAKVAREGKGLAIPDVHICEFYREANADTRSELAVPVKTTGDSPRLLAVLNLEFAEKSNLTATNATSLERDAGGLVGPLLCLAALRQKQVTSWPWLPDEDGWSLARLWRDICHHLSDAIDRHKASCVIWHADWEKRVYYALASSGFHEAHQGDETTIPMDKGRTQEAMRLGEGEVLVVDGRDPRLVNGLKLRALGLKQMVAIPVRLPGACTSDVAAGTLNLYQYGPQVDKTLVDKGDAAEAVKLIGQFLARNQDLRAEVACADLTQRLECSSWAPADPIAVRDVVQECLEGDDCSVLVREFLADGPRESRRLVGVTTAGIRMQIPEEPPRVDREPNLLCAEYNSDQDDGLIQFLVQHPDIVIRKLNVSAREPDDIEGLPHDGHLGPWNDDMPTPERRFLGISISHMNETIAVICIGRSITRPPFTRWDAELLRKLARVWRQRLIQKLPQSSRPKRVCLSEEEYMECGWGE